MDSKWYTWRQWWAKNWLLVAIFVLSVCVKWLFWLNHQSFTQDQVRDYQLIEVHWQAWDFYIPLGPAAASYSKFSVLPGYYYVQLLAQGLCGHQFYAMAWAVIILESCTPCILYWYLKKLTDRHKTAAGEWAALLGTLIYVFSPLVTMAGSQAWNPNLVPLCSLIFLVCSHEWLLERRGWCLTGAIVSFVALANLHFQWFVLLPLAVADAVKYFHWRHESRKYWWIGILISVIMCAPYIHYELTHWLDNWHEATTWLTSGAPAVERLRKPVYYGLFFPGFYTRFVTGELYWLAGWGYLYQPDWLWTPTVVVSMVLFWALIGWYVWEIWWMKGRNLHQAWSWALPGLNLVAMALMLRLYKGDKPDYFLYTFMPYAVIMLTICLAQVRQKVIVYTIFFLIIVQELFALYKMPTNGQYQAWQQAAAKIAQLPADETNVVVTSQEMVVPYNYFFPTQTLGERLSEYYRYNVLLCQAGQWCLNFVANESDQANRFKYDLVNWTDYSVFLPELSEVERLDLGDLQMVILTQTEGARGEVGKETR